MRHQEFQSMTRRALQLTAFAATLSMALAIPRSEAKANFFEYSTSVAITTPISPGSVTVTPGPANTFGATETMSDQAGLNQFTFHTNSTVLASPSPSNLNFGPITVDAAAGTLTTYSFGFSYILTITDFGNNPFGPSLGTGTATFSGRVDGTLGINGGIPSTTLNINSLAPTFALVSTGAATFLVFNATDSDPGPSGGGGFIPGSISARLTAVPEPTSMALLGIGGASLWGLAQRRRRQVAQN
jgi:hypothetical protein